MVYRSKIDPDLSGRPKFDGIGPVLQASLDTPGLRYQYRPDLAFSDGAMYLTSPTSDGRRNVALPLDRVFAAGVGVVKSR